jgi:hypothetical protein
MMSESHFQQSSTCVRAVGLSALLALCACAREDSPPASGPKGKPKEEDTRLLEKGSGTLQSFDPVAQIDTYLDGFHPMKDNPSHAMEAHHFCHARNEEFTQCVLFDANTANANLVGIEYIISERLFESLSADEQKLWHPHNYEILSGQLIAPGLPDVAEIAFLQKKMNSYGKTWHTWDTSAPEQKTLPLGPPMLMWSYNADGEVTGDQLRERDKRMNVDTDKKRSARKDLATDAHPQRGVHALSSSFPARSVPDFVKERGD